MAPIKAATQWSKWSTNQGPTGRVIVTTVPTPF